jgi:hypothetical protein
MRIYKLKFESNEQALDFFESIKDGLIECVEVDNVENEFDIIHENENLITTFEVFPTIIKHNFL